MNRASNASLATLRHLGRLVLGSSRSSNAFVLLALLSLLALSGCAATPPCQPGPVVPPGPDLMKAPPPEGWFRKNLDRILAPTYTGQPTAPTN